MLYLTGDCHGTDPMDGIHKLSNRHFPQQRSLTKEDFVLILGDFGLVWDGSKEEQWWLHWLEETRPFTTLFLPGNHENYDLLARYPLIPWRGGMVRQIRPSVFCLCSGYVFDLGQKVFVMGGAQSHDMEVILTPSPNLKQQERLLRYRHVPYRMEGASWWPEELPGAETYDLARTSLAAVDWAVDLVATHCAPTDIQRHVSPASPENALTDFLQEMRSKLQYHLWACGHYHTQLTLPQERFQIFYRDILPFP